MGGESEEMGGKCEELGRKLFLKLLVIRVALKCSLDAVGSDQRQVKSKAGSNPGCAP